MGIGGKVSTLGGCRSRIWTYFGLVHNESVLGIGGFESRIWTYFWASRS